MLHLCCIAVCLMNRPDFFDDGIDNLSVFSMCSRLGCDGEVQDYPKFCEHLCIAETVCKKL